MDEDEDGDVTEDALLGGRVRLLQPRRGHRAGTDAVLLAGLAPVRPGDRAVDLGSASGAVGLMLAAREPTLAVVLVDRDPALVELARANARLNGVEDRVRAVRADAFAPWPEDLLGRADLVVTNPPYLESGSRRSDVPGRGAARVMEGGDLSAWIGSAAALLAPKGRLRLVYRADGLERCLVALRPAFGALAITPVRPRADAPASRLLVSAVKGSGAPTTIEPGFVLHGPDGAFTPAAERLHRGLADASRSG